MVAVCSYSVETGLGLLGTVGTGRAGGIGWAGVWRVNVGVDGTSIPDPSLSETVLVEKVAIEAIIAAHEIRCPLSQHVHTM